MRCRKSSAPKIPDAMTQRLLLIGGGHAHIQVIRDARLSALRNVQRVLLSDSTTTTYSGLLPAVVAGLTEETKVDINLQELCAANNFRFVHGTVTGVNPDLQYVTFQPGGHDGVECKMYYNVLSINVGSTTKRIPFGHSPPPDGRVVYTRPITKLIPALRAFESSRSSGDKSPPQALVVGAGAAGLELALALQGRMDARVTIVSGEPSFEKQAGKAAADAVVAELRQRGMILEIGHHIDELRASPDGKRGEAELDNGRVLSFDLAVVATGAAPSPLLLATNLALDNQGWIIVRPCLRVKNYDNVFAVGDCVSFGDRFGPGNPPKAGVFAVRQGPVLIHNLRLALTHDWSSSGTPWREFAPQSSYLALISTGDGRAIGTKFGLVFKGTWVFRLKMHLDETWQNKFRVRSESKFSRQSKLQQKSLDDKTFEWEKRSPTEAAAALIAGDDICSDDSFDNQLAILKRMDDDQEFCNAVQLQLKEKR